MSQFELKNEHMGRGSTALQYSHVTEVSNMFYKVHLPRAQSLWPKRISCPTIFINEWEYITE